MFQKVSVSINRDYADSFQNITILNVLYGEIKINLTDSYDVTLDQSSEFHSLANLLAVSSTHWIGGWVGPKEGLDAVAN